MCVLYHLRGKSVASGASVCYGNQAINRGLGIRTHLEKGAVAMINLPPGGPGSAPGSAPNEIGVAFLDGTELRGTVASFNPQMPTFFLQSSQPSDDVPTREIGFEGVRMISFFRNPAIPKNKVTFPSTARLVTVRFLDGETIHGVTQSYSGARIGLYLVPTALEDVERIYVPISAIRDVVSVKRLGEIFTEQGMATPEMIERAINQQQQLRDEQVGQILLKKKVITGEQLGQGLAAQKQKPGKRIGDILLEQGFIDGVQLDEALETQSRQRDKKLGEIMVDMGYATYKMIGIALAIQFNVPFMDLSNQTINPQLRELVPVNVARRLQVLAISLQQGVLTIAIADPTEQSAQDELRKITGLTVITVVATPQDIARAIARIYGP